MWNKLIIFLLPFVCLACSNEKKLSKQEVIDYINVKYVSKEGKTPKTVIVFKTDWMKGERARSVVEQIAAYGYQIELDSQSNGRKDINTYEEFIDFYQNAFLPLSVKDLDSFEGESSYKLINDMLFIKNVCDSDEKDFYFNHDGYRERLIEIFNRQESDYSFKITITSTHTY